jgi:hypothetical protein
MTTKSKAIMGVGLALGIGAVMMPLASYADTDTESAEVRVTVNESITITGVNNQALGLNFTGGDISAGTVRSGTHAVTVSTSAVDGYTLAMRANSAADANLTLLTDGTGATNVYGGAVGFTSVAGSATAAAVGTGQTFATLGTGVVISSATVPANGIWGYRLSGWTADNFVGIPTSDFVISANDGAATESTTVTFGAQAGTTTPAGTYGAWITYTATTN